MDTAGTTTATTTLVSRIASATIPQGSGSSQKTGSSVRITSAELRLNITAATTSTNGNSVRVIATRNRTPGAAVVADVLETTTNFVSEINSDFAARGLELLMDQVYELGTNNSDNCTVNIHRVWTAPDWHQCWDAADTGGTPGQLTEGAIQVFWYVDQVSVAAPVFLSNMRLRYVDN